MNSTTHIAGPTITACGRVIQRCGEKLCDSKGVAMSLNEDGSTPKFSTWKTGRLIRVTQGNPTSFILLDDTDRLPDDSCFDLVED